MTSTHGESMIKLFWSRVNKNGENGCWLWEGTIDKRDNRGVFTFNQTTVSVHRFSYKLYYGPFDPKGDIIQTCGIRNCVNPEHLQLYQPSLADRFWSKVQKQDGNNCWLWIAFRNGQGYGMFFEKGKKTEKAYRISYKLTYGPIPAGLCVCHKCDNPQCVRPDHLFLGTNEENYQDCVNKGRNRGIPSILKEHEIHEIKKLIALGWKSPAIIEKFPSATRSMIADIKRGKLGRRIA